MIFCDGKSYSSHDPLLLVSVVAVLCLSSITSFASNPYVGKVRQLSDCYLGYDRLNIADPFILTKKKGFVQIIDESGDTIAVISEKSFGQFSHFNASEDTRGFGEASGYFFDRGLELKRISQSSSIKISNTFQGACTAALTDSNEAFEAVPIESKDITDLKAIAAVLVPIEIDQNRVASLKQINLGAGQNQKEECLMVWFKESDKSKANFRTVFLIDHSGEKPKVLLEHTVKPDQYDMFMDLRNRIDFDHDGQIDYLTISFGDFYPVLRLNRVAGKHWTSQEIRSGSD
jgi:hypothetical protein